MLSGRRREAVFRVEALAVSRSNHGGEATVRYVFIVRDTDECGTMKCMWMMEGCSGGRDVEELSKDKC